jgi:hypothetical protein
MQRKKRGGEKTEPPIKKRKDLIVYLEEISFKSARVHVGLYCVLPIIDDQMEIRALAPN